MAQKSFIVTKGAILKLKLPVPVNTDHVEAEVDYTSPVVCSPVVQSAEGWSCEIAIGPVVDEREVVHINCFPIEVPVLVNHYCSSGDPVEIP